MWPGEEGPVEGVSGGGVPPLPQRNEMHYASGVFEQVDWSKRGAYMEKRHGITPQIATDALGDAN